MSWPMRAKDSPKESRRKVVLSPMNWVGDNGGYDA